MTANIVQWIWHLPSQDLSALIGVSLILLGIVIAILRKIGDWS